MDLAKIFKDNSDGIIEMQHKDTKEWKDFEYMSEEVFIDIVGKLLKNNIK